MLNLGGGYGIWYAEGDAQQSVSDYTAYLRTVIEAVKTNAAKFAMPEPVPCSSSRGARS